MRTLLTAIIFLTIISTSFSQNKRVQPQKYPSLLWEITGNGLSKPSYLFGTMHVSSKMVFHLSDSFYLGIKNADVVALETDPGNWQEDFSRYDLDGQGLYNGMSRWRGGMNPPQDFFTINTLHFFPYEKMIEMALYNSPAIVNNFLYRTNSAGSSDFEEDTYLDLHIFQVGKKLGKKLCGVENFDKSMQLMKEAYIDASKEKNTKEKSYDYNEDFSYAKLEDAYRTGNLDLLDTINKVNSTSAAFDEKFLYKRNEIQAGSIDSILKTKASLFVGVGAAHLPGQRGVIELLRRKGYTLRPIKMNERDSKHKEEIEKIHVPVQFSKQTSKDGFFNVSMPGKLYSFTKPFEFTDQEQYADMINGSYYMVTRINTNAIAWGHNPETVENKIDSVIYENVPGKILNKQSIVRNGFRGFDITNRTRRGDYQRYNIFISPFEVIIFKMSGNGDYVKDSKEANQFFGSIELKEYKNEWTKYSPQNGGFQVELPHQPVILKEDNWQCSAIDNQTGTSFEVLRNDIHNYDFVEEDSFDLNLMEESFATSDFIDKQLSRKQTTRQGYPALETKYRYKDGSVALVTFIIQGPHYYTLITHNKTENQVMNRFLNSFMIIPYVYPQSLPQKDTSLYYTVRSAVPLEKPQKIEMYPTDLYRYGRVLSDDDSLEENGIYKDKLVENDSTGEKIYISFYKPPRYYFDTDTTQSTDSAHFKTEKIDWVYRSRKKYQLPDKTSVLEYVLGDPKSSRMVQGKYFTRNGVNYRLETEGDTLSKQSSFITDFFNSFTPSDTVQGTNPRLKKAHLYFTDFFSKDTLLHKRAVRNINKLDFDSSDFSQLKKCIQSLSWKEKKYLDVKKDFIWQLASIRTKEASDYLKELYYAAGDTVEIQYTALKALLKQKNTYAFNVFRDIMVNEPPVLDVDRTTTYTPDVRNMIYSTTTVSTRNYNNSDDDDDDYSNRNGSFFDDLTDSLQLTASIFKDILPLINIHDYEKPMMDLMETLVDSNMIAAKDYELYFPKFLIEAKQQLKKQIINEKNKSIEKAQADPDESTGYRGNDRDKDYGNRELSLYATLLLPFWDKNPAVPQLLQQLLNSSDNRLKYNTAMLLVRNGKPIPDTLLTYFASNDNYRYELYTDLKEDKKVNLFPAAYDNHIALARSKLLNMRRYNVPDSVVYVDKLPINYKGKAGSIYFFKYKQKKDDEVWKLASVGIVPDDSKMVEFDNKKNNREEDKYDFTDLLDTKIALDEPMKDQLKKAMKKLTYAKRNSAAEFYNDENRSGMDLLRGLTIKD